MNEYVCVCWRHPSSWGRSIVIGRHFHPQRDATCTATSPETGGEIMCMQWPSIVWDSAKDIKCTEMKFYLQIAIPRDLLTTPSSVVGWYARCTAAGWETRISIRGDIWLACEYKWNESIPIINCNCDCGWCCIYLFTISLLLCVSCQSVSWKQSGELYQVSALQTVISLNLWCFMPANNIIQRPETDDEP